MAKWLRYLAGPSTPAWAAQSDAAHAVYKLTSSLKQIFGLEHAGRPAGIGLGWMHLGANDDPSHIIEKTGGGAGFTTYIAIHPASHTALFVAATDGPPHAPTQGPGIFRASTDGLLALAGLPPLPERQVRRIPRRRITHAAIQAHGRRPGTNEHSARVSQPRAAKSTQSAQ
jgi:D-alanyl-D-alanine-carboxypeptidase/D-alanyl-D-alanine-endopeptidase